MSLDVQERDYSTGERLMVLVTRALKATLLTAFVGAIGNGFYERLFASELLAAGDPFARGVFMLAVSFPYIFVGLILLGLPSAYALMRARAENFITYGLAGTASGALWGKVTFGVLTKYGIAISAVYGCTCALFWWALRPRT